MLPRLKLFAACANEEILAAARHALMVIPVGANLADGAIPFVQTLRQAMARRRVRPEDLGREALLSQTAAGGLLSWIVLDTTRSVFEQQTALRKALAPLLSEEPSELHLAIQGEPGWRARVAPLAAHVALVNGTALPTHKTRNKPKGVKQVTLHGHAVARDFALARAVAEGSALTRSLTLLPPNELTPGLYRARIRRLARDEGWKLMELDFERLRRMGAGAFCAVAQGSLEKDAAIVRLTYAPRRARHALALVGKGICFDTGGHNLKPARHMHGMHKDMNGSAVVLGILLAATRLQLPLRIDAWLALAQNHISPAAYKQNDVVTALNGTTIEVVHTDAEGRMVLADTLTLAAREKPDWMLDFATLTGSMKVALGNRYSGVLSNSTALLDAAIAAGQASGERVCAFPIDADYEAALESKVADIKQCTMEGDADHILAARFLMRFIEDRPWLHMDLSADDCEGGLGAVASEVTGFGVGWGVEMLKRLPNG